ncbi:MAG TPA: magnesium chelatase subunit D family protein [Frankiaceae bacterium]
MTQLRFPFTAVVGHDDLRLALCLNAVDPLIGGVLVRGEKGTAKSTVVRALAALLPPVAVVPGCRFSCDPERPDPECPDGPHDPTLAGVSRAARLVELPVGATEDRLAGSLDLERALTEGVKAFEPGLLAQANRGVLYVDEVNLLHDHLVDTLLDAAAMGRTHVEREGVSVSHSARFLLVGTMNPEEGELRPQLLDRFGLTVEVTASRDPDERAEVVRRRLAFDADPAGFVTRWVAAEEDLALRIAAARALLPRVTLSDRALRQVTAVCAAFDVDGLRADLVTARTAMTLAAWEGRRRVDAEDVRMAATLALPHRRRRGPFDAPGLDQNTLDDTLRTVPKEPKHQRPNDDDENDGPEPDGDGDGPSGPPPPRGGGRGQRARQGQTPPPASTTPEPRRPAAPRGTQAAADTDATEEVPAGGRPRPARGGAPVDADPVAPGAAFRPKLLTVAGLGGGATGRRSRAITDSGRTVGVDPRGTRVHPLATVLAAAPHQKERGRSGAGLILLRSDLRNRRVEGKESNLVLFCVDASGSMAAQARMQAVKGAVLSLLLDAYQRRDKVGMVSFRGRSAELLLPPTSSVQAAAVQLSRLPTGGRTPLAAGLLRCGDVLRTEKLRDPRRRPLLVVVTDGRANGERDALGRAERAAGVLLAGPMATGQAVVVDCESGVVRLGLAGRLATALRAESITLRELSAGSLTALVRSTRGDVPAWGAA